MAWLISLGGAPVGLEDDSDLLRAMLVLDRFRDRLGGDALQLLDRVLEEMRDGVLSPDLDDALRDIPGGGSRLAELWSRLTLRLVDQVPEDFRFLLGAFSDVETHADGGTAVVWPIIDRSDEVLDSAAGGLSFKLNLKAGASATIQPRAPWPDDVPVDGGFPELLRLAISGHLGADMRGGASLAGVPIGVGAGKTLSTRLEAWLKHRAGERVARALLDDLASWVSPFDVHRLERQFRAGNLVAMRIEAEHELRFSGEVGLTRGVALAEGAAATLGASFGFGLKEKGRFEYRVRAVPDGRVAVGLKRLASRTESTRQAVEIGIDLSRWAERAYPVLLDRLGEAGEVIERVRDQIQGRDGFRQVLGDALVDHLNTPAAADIVKALLERDEGGDLADVVARVLAPRIESALALWVPDVDQAATDLATELAASLHLPTALGERLAEAVEPGLAAVRASLRKRVAALVRTRKGFVALAERLQKVTGRRIDLDLSGARKRADAVMEPLIVLLDRVQIRMDNLKHHFETAAQARVQLRFFAESSAENARGLDVEFELDPGQPDAQQAFDRLLTGELQGLFDDVRDKRLGDAIRLVRGSFTRYANLDSKEGFAAVILGFGFSATTLMDINSSIAIDTHGNLQVLSRLEWHRQYRTRHDERDLAFVNAFELAGPARRQGVSLSLNLSLADEAFEPEDARAFFGSAEKVGLLPPGAARRAEALLDVDTLRKGRFDIGLMLTPDQCLRLLRIGQPAWEKDELLAIAAAHIADVVETLPHDRRQLQLIAGLQAELRAYGIDLGENLYTGIQRVTRKKVQRASGKLEGIYDESAAEIRHAEDALSWLLARRFAVIGCHQACVARHEKPQDGLLDVLSLMREIYLSPDDGVEWQPRDYTDRQRRIGRAIERWSYWGHDWHWWLINDKRARPLTLALFRTLADLAQGDDAAEPIRLTASLLLGGAAGPEFHLIA